jgi:RimJ/RimL family protein N-acetyltransferase
MRVPASSRNAPFMLAATRPADGSRPPVRSSLANPLWKIAAPPSCQPQLRPSTLAGMPLSTSEDHEPFADASPKMLPTRFRLDYNSIGDGTAVPFNRVFVSAARHKNSLSLGAKSCKDFTMHELPVTHPHVIRLFTAGGPNDTMLFATLEGRYPGHAMVNEARFPSQSVLRTHYGTTFCGGQVMDRLLAEAMTSLRTIGAVRLVVSEQDFATRSLPPESSRTINRLEFATRARQHGNVESWIRQLPATCRIVPLDRPLLARCLWHDEIREACGSPETFLAQSFGVCMIHHNTIVSEAYAMFEGAGRVEVGVVTHAPYRGRNYAAMTCAHLIRKCEARGKPTYWSCHQTNTASIRVARKLGYTGERVYHWVRYERT